MVIIMVHFPIIGHLRLCELAEIVSDCVGAPSRA